MLDIALRDWALQTNQYSLEDFTVFMYKAEKYRRDTAATTGSNGFYSNYRGITLEDVSCPPSLVTASTSDISELASTFSLFSDSQTAQITALMAAMMKQRLPSNTNKERRNSSRQGGNQQGKKSENKNPTAGHMVSQQTWNTTVARERINTRTTRMLQHSTTAWAYQITYVNLAKTLADLDPQTEAEERQCLV